MLLVGDFKDTFFEADSRLSFYEMCIEIIVGKFVLACALRGAHGGIFCLGAIL